MGKIMFHFCYCMLIAIFSGCQISSPATGAFKNNKSPLQLKIILPKDIYTSRLCTKATVRSGAMRGEKFEKELKKLIFSPNQARHFLSATQPIPYIIKNISRQKVLLFRRINVITIRLEGPEGGKIICGKRPNERCGVMSFGPEYLEYDCITVLEPDEFIADVVMPSEYEKFPVPKSVAKAKTWCLYLDIEVQSLPPCPLKRAGIEFFKGRLVSNKVKAVILPSSAMEWPNVK